MGPTLASRPALRMAARSSPAMKHAGPHWTGTGWQRPDSTARCNPAANHVHPDITSQAARRDSSVLQLRVFVSFASTGRTAQEGFPPAGHDLVSNRRPLARLHQLLNVRQCTPSGGPSNGTDFRAR